MPGINNEGAKEVVLIRTVLMVLMGPHPIAPQVRLRSQALREIAMLLRSLMPTQLVMACHKASISRLHS